jgi:gliding motility-associated-like protein
MAIRFIIIFLFSGILNLTVSAQVDTEFWFAAPEVDSSHADRPVYLRVSALRKSALVTITQPANTAFIPIQQLIAANSTVSIDLTSQLQIIENKPANQVLKYGINIKATNPVTAYYEVLGTSTYGVVNTDIFVLKGNHALGKEFYTPFQTHWNNNSGGTRRASFDIVATEDNTTVTITPSKDIIGHAAGITYSILLQKGQTYSGCAVSTLANEHPAGSHITSNKPIAVTTKDDSIEDSPNYDLAGDQIIPVNFTGIEYIAVKVSDTINTDRIYVLATKANTSIYLDGAAIPVTVLNAGETFEYQLLSPTAYITSSDSVYVWHVAGFSRELGGAILPPLGCTGSRQVSFTRSTDEEFFIDILVKSGYEQYFKLNGQHSLIPTTAFATVNGSGAVWKYAKIFFDASVIASGSTNIIKNDSADFHLGTLNGGLSTGFRYGYFSDFGFLELGSDKSFCKGDSTVLDAGFLRDSYLWNTGETGEFITVKDSGYYNVTITKGLCSSKDTVHISFYPEVTADVLGNDTSACANSGLKIKTLNPFFSYHWNTGSKDRIVHPTHTGNYSVTVKNKFGCKKSDTMFVKIFPIPHPEILYDTDLDAFCKNPFVHLQAKGNFDHYLWSTGDTTSSIVTIHNEKDIFTLLVSDSKGCKNIVSTDIDCSPVIGLVPNLLTPNNDGLNDIFYIEYLRPGTWIFEIYNRWGDRVYQKDGYDNSFNAEVLNDGIYYFSLRHKEGKGERKGWLEVIRDKAH